MANRGISTTLLLRVYLLAPMALMMLPISVFESSPSICLFRSLFGMHCPGCGMTRAVVCVLHADFARAWSYNKMVIVVFPLLSWSWSQRVMAFSARYFSH